MKLIDAVKKFSGGRGEDVEFWMDKFLLTAEITIENKDEKTDDRLAKILPIFLEGAAYTTWKQMPPAKQSDLSAIKAELMRMFGRSKLRAWQDLKETKLIPGESVDLVVDQIKSALGVMIGNRSAVPEQLVSYHLVDALPKQIVPQVKVQCGEKMELSQIISCAKALLANPSELLDIAAAGTTSVGTRQRWDPQRTNKPRCSGCKRIGHLLRDCNTICYSCGEVGHLRSHCPKSTASGNGRAEVDVPDHAAPASAH